MSATDRNEAQSRRAEARRRRRGEDESNGAAPVEHKAGSDQPDEHAGLGTVAKVAAAGAALGAAVGAALANRDEPGEQPAEESGDEQEAHAEPDLDEGRDEPHADGSDDDQPEAEDDDGEEEPTVAAEPAAEQAEFPASARQESERHEEPRDQPRPARHGAPPSETAEVVRVAREQLGALLGKEPESVSALARIDDGWVVTLEVVELPRVPDSTDVLASYELELDEDRNVIRYARRRRYSRSQADADGGL